MNSLFHDLGPQTRVYNGLVLPVRFNGQTRPYLALIDSGADRSIMSARIVKEVNANFAAHVNHGNMICMNQHVPITMISDTSRIVSASNAPLPIVGAARNVQIRIGVMDSYTTIPHAISVIESLSPDMIIGLDLLKYLNMQIDFSSQSTDPTLRVCTPGVDANCVKYDMGHVKQRLREQQQHRSQSRVQSVYMAVVPTEPKENIHSAHWRHRRERIRPL